MGVTESTIISLGSNLGDRQHYLQEAINAISKRIGHVNSESSIYETPPWGFETNNSFLNMCIEVYTNLAPLTLLKNLKVIETELGREKSTSDGYSSRKIDLDIILFGKQILTNKILSIPHPRFKDRRFVLQPLNDIAPNRIDPNTHLTIAQLLANCTDQSIIECYSKKI